MQRKTEKKNVSQLIHLEFLTLSGLIAHNFRVHFLNIYLSRESIAEHAPPAPLKHFAFRHYGDALWRCLMQLQYSTGDYSAAPLDAAGV